MRQVILLYCLEGGYESTLTGVALSRESMGIMVAKKCAMEGVKFTKSKLSTLLENEAVAIGNLTFFTKTVDTDTLLDD